MAKLTDRQREQLIAMGMEKKDNGKAKYTQQFLADKFGIARSMVNRYIKEKVNKSEQIVDEEVRIIGEFRELEKTKSELFTHKEAQEVNKQVLNKLRRQEKYESNAEKGLDKVATMFDQIDTPNDALTLARTNDILGISLGIADRHAPKIDVTQLQQQTASSDVTVVIEEDKAVK